MSSNEHRKLETEIEREAYNLVTQIKEHMYDHTMIYLNRANSNIDRETAHQILEIAKIAIEDGFMTKVDFFKKGIDHSLTVFTETENPLQRGEQRKEVIK